MSGHPISTVPVGSLAPLEPGHTTEEPWNVEINLAVTKGAAWTGNLTVASDIGVLLQDYMEGMGKVDLIDLAVTYKLAKDEFLIAVVSGTHSSHTIARVQSLRHALNVTANAFNCGILTTQDLKIPDRFTRQIQPASATAPPFKLFLSASTTANVSLSFRLKHHGPRILQSELVLN